MPHETARLSQREESPAVCVAVLMIQSPRGPEPRTPERLAASEKPGRRRRVPRAGTQASTRAPQERKRNPEAEGPDADQDAQIHRVPSVIETEAVQDLAAREQGRVSWNLADLRRQPEDLPVGTAGAGHRGGDVT